MAVDPSTIVEVCLALHLRRASRRISRWFDAALAPHGLDISQFNLLSAVAALESAPLTTIAEILGVDPSTLSRTLKPLSRQNLVSITGGRGRGGLHLSLSLRGQDVFSAASQAWKATQSQIAQALGEAQASRVLENLDHLERVAAAPH